MNGPSEKALHAIRKASAWDTASMPAKARITAAVEAAHDPALGLDRSVCLRDVVEAIHRRYRDTSVGILCGDFREAADFIEREFGGGS